MMDPDRVRSYLKASCAGLGFDIGEVWFTSNESGISTLTAIDNTSIGEDGVSQLVQKSTVRRNKRFLQLYTSKSYNTRRSDLLRPSSENTYHRTSSTDDLQKHVLSPRLVDAISKTAQVVWANCPKKEGLLGRSDMRLQTAVAMPVAMDSEGNMCVVIMFSPRNIQSSSDSMEFLKFISQSAASTTIPCLLPVIENSQKKLEYSSNEFDSFQREIDSKTSRKNSVSSSNNVQDLASVPKDLYGIPILPPYSQLDVEPKTSTAIPCPADNFDDISYGVWSSISNTPIDDFSANNNVDAPIFVTDNMGLDSKSLTDINISSATKFLNVEKEILPTRSDSSSPELLDKPILHPQQQERLEEFASAFLGMSVFDAADVWIPSGVTNCLCHQFTVRATDRSEGLNYFKDISEGSLVKIWSGAVGKAYGSGNPIWSTNKNIITDSDRCHAFSKASIKTAIAVPIFSKGAVAPSCVFCCYSMIRSESVPFVLRFLQQALRLLWLGLDNVKPHRIVDKELWRDIAPSDLGEMAADTEMQQAFLKKRPHEEISQQQTFDNYTNVTQKAQRNRSSSLAFQLNILNKQPKLDNFQDASSDFRNRSSSLAIQLNSLNMNFNNDNYTDSKPNIFQSSTIKSVNNDLCHTSHQQKGLNHVWNIQNQASYPSNSSSDVFSSPPSNFTNKIYQHNSTQYTGNTPQHFSLNKTMLPVNKIINTHSNPEISVMSTLSNSQTFVSNCQQEDRAAALAYIESLNAMAKNNQINASANKIKIEEADLHQVNNANNASDPLLIPLFNRMQPNVTSIPDVANSSSLPGNSSLCHPIDSSNAPFQLGNQRPCRIQGCDQYTCSRRPYCIKHSGNRLCEHPGCAKCAQGATRFCIAHGGGRRCTYPGCDKGARDKYFCAAHGGGKRCRLDGCNKSAVGGSSLCTSHGGGRRCSVPGCEKSAQSSTKFCVKHGGGKKCSHSGCDKVARGKTLFCAAHGGGIRCKLEGCNRVAIGRLQLCRTHGGGSNSKSKMGEVHLPPPPTAFQSSENSFSIIPP